MAASLPKFLEKEIYFIRESSFALSFKSERVPSLEPSSTKIHSNSYSESPLHTLSIS